MEIESILVEMLCLLCKMSSLAPSLINSLTENKAGTVHNKVFGFFPAGMTNVTTGQGINLPNNGQGRLMQEVAELPVQGVLRSFSSKLRSQGAMQQQG